MFPHTHTVSTAALIAGDVALMNGGRVIASVERNISNLSAALVRFTDGTWFHAGIGDAWPISR